MTHAAQPIEPTEIHPIQVRKMPFEYPDDLKPHWAPKSPEWSHIVNAASLLMPYLEPYLIDAIRAAYEHIDDPVLLEEAKGYVGQESEHFKQHAKFNRLIVAKGYEELRAIEEEMERSYDRLRAEKDLEFHLAYAAGFETMALAIGHMLIELREDLFEGTDPNVTSLVLWHFVEELEHKRAAFDVYQHVVGKWPKRAWALITTITHSMLLVRKGYKVMLKKDGRWGTLRSRWELKKVLFKIFRSALPYLVESLHPRHDPAKIADPEWIRDWQRLYDAGEPGLVRLDTRNMRALPSEMLATAGA